MNKPEHPDRFCASCGSVLPPGASILICTRCALLEAAAGVEPATEQVQSGFADAEADDVQVQAQTAGFGMQIGRYKILEKVGEGGWGTVYVAEQQEPVRRRVALKVIKLGMDTRQVIARFEAERQALAMMDHPNIAKVLDAGTTKAGRPFFVMELVRGIRITDYCDQEHLSTQERLGLFIRVCHAIQHAHQKGIIHRDIKPSNILVTLHDGVPVPKVIDFGIAKATEGRLTDKTVYTQLHQLVGTPAYMSPEQAEMSGLDIDTRSDVYSLGVLLYELLTGKPPFDPGELAAVGIDEMRRTIREKDPVRPSTRLESLPREELTTTAKRRSAEAPRLVQSVKGDLDWIVMKCLEKDRTRRYETADRVALDVVKHLENEPVSARPPSAAYRFQKMIRRNRKAFAGAVVVAIALVLGLSAALVALVQVARAKGKEAELRKQAQAEELISRRRAYAAEMNTAFRALEDNNLGHVVQMLDRQRPKPGEKDLRGFEWRWLWQEARDKALMTWPGEDSKAAAYSPDGRLLAYSFKDITIRDAKTRTLITRLPTAASSLSFSPDSALLAGGHLANVVVWDTRSWRQVRSLPNTHLPVRFSPDGRLLVTGSPEGYRFWKTDTWEPAGLASGSATDVPANVIAFSPNGQFLLTAWAGDFFKVHQIRVWHLPGLEELAPIELGDPLTSGIPVGLTFSADGTYVIAGRQLPGTLSVWDFKTRKLIKTVLTHTVGIFCVCTTSDGRWLVSAGNDRTVRLWDLATFEPVATIGAHAGEVWSLAVSPDGREVVSGSTHPPETKLWSTAARDTKPTLKGPDFIVDFLDHGRLLVGNITNDLAIWDPADGTQVHLPIFDSLAITDYNAPWAVSPDNSVLAVARSDGTVETWSLTSRQNVSTWQAHQDKVLALGFSSDGRLLASGSKRGQIKLWDFASRGELSHFAFPGTNVNCLAFSPDDKLLSACGFSNLVVWNWATRKEIIRSDYGASVVQWAAFSPDGNLLAVATGGLTEVHLWDTKTGTKTAVLKGLTGSAACVAFSPDGLTLAAGAFQVKLWHVPTLQELATIDEGGPPSSLAFSPDGRTLAIAYFLHAKYISLWRAPSLQEIERIESRK